MMKQLFLVAVCFMIIFSVQITYAQEELPLPEGKNIREWESISAALVGEDRFEEAIIYLDKILEEDPENLKALSNKAGLLVQLERFSESVILSNKVLEIDPNRISTLTNKAIALKMLEEYEESFLTFSKILVLEPENDKVKKARANLLSSTPTIPTSGSAYEVHVLVTLRNSEGQLIAVTESTNARFLPSLFTEKWWDRLDDEGKIISSDRKQIFQNSGKIIPSDDYLGMLTLERQMSGYDVNIFEVFFPMIQIEEADEGKVQWTIIKN